MFRENGVSNSVNDMSTMLNNFREKTERGAAAPKWGRTSQRTTNTRPRDISNATGGTMTTRSGEPASKRESYTAYMEGRAAAVREPRPPSQSLDGREVTTLCLSRARFA